MPIRWTPDDRAAFERAGTCHLCDKPLYGDKVVNHDHLTGRYLGAAHNACNLAYRVPGHIPVFFHNLRGYDCHHLMQGFGKMKDEKMTCIAKNSEQYISVSLASLRFLDSLQFMMCSLDGLVKNLTAEGPANFRILHQCSDPAHVDLLLRKGVFPYAWMTGAEKLRQDHLPPREDFFNDLTQTAVAEEDYQHAVNVWNTLGMSTMQEYHDLYLRTDVLLLADVFESFRRTSMHHYGIDPCNVYSAPGLAWQAMLKKTGVRLELLTDVDMHLFVEKGIRGGVAMIPHRHAVANNPALSAAHYDPGKATSYLLDLDCNNLYGTAMCQPLPRRDFRWLTREGVASLDVSSVPQDSTTGYILEVDLHYPPHLHDLHSDYPLAPERGSVTREMMSPYCTDLLDALNLHPGTAEKLLTTLEDKKNYVVHYRALQLYLTLGMELRRVHRVLAFQQSAWLAPFIQFNTDRRKAARNDFEKDFFKLMNNATYGKSLENVRSRIDFKLVAGERQLVKWVASPRLKTFFAFNRDLAGLTLKKTNVTLNRPVYVGLTVLDVSKTVMYDFHYNWTVRKYGQDAKLCMTDTDSLLYHIRTEDVYADMAGDADLFDTSNYPPDHPNYSPTNARSLGKFKDEFGGKPLLEFVGLRAKCYSLLDDRLEEKRVAKGVPRTAIRKQLRHEQYRNCLQRHHLKRTSTLSINSHLHRLVTEPVDKLALSPFDNKRYVLEDGVRTLAYGHHTIGDQRRPGEDDGGPPPPKRRRGTGDDSDLLELAAMLDEDSPPSPRPSTSTGT